MVQNDKQAVLKLVPGAQCVKGGSVFKILAAGAVIASGVTEDEAWKTARSIKENLAPLASVAAVRVCKSEVVCPYCERVLARQSVDPRGRVIGCDKCGRTFNVAVDAVIVF